MNFILSGILWLFLLWVLSIFQIFLLTRSLEKTLEFERETWLIFIRQFNKNPSENPEENQNPEGQKDGT